MNRHSTHSPSYSSTKECTRKSILAAAMTICLLFSSAVASAQLSISANPGTSPNAPLGTSNYAANESIYTATELSANFSTAGDEIVSIGFTCTTIPTAGTTFNNLKIYFKEVSAATTVFTAGAYSTTGYTQVFGGATGGSIVVTSTGVKTLSLSTPFLRTSSSLNLQMLVTREDNTLHTGGIFATAGGNLADATALSTRRYNSTVALSGTTSLGTSTFRPAIILTSAIPTTPPNCATGLGPASGTVALPCPSATTSPSSITFTWTAPASGPTPIGGYKFYSAVAPAAPVFLGTVTGTAAVLSNQLPSTTYNWYVVPTNGVDAVGCATPLTYTTDVEPPCVANNTCATATAIGTVGNAGTVNSTTTGASISRAGEACEGFTGNPDDDVWFRFTTDGDGGNVNVAVTAAATVLDPVIQIYSGTCTALVNILCADANVAGAAPANNETAALTGLAANTTYYVRVYGYGSFSVATPTSGIFTIATSGTGVAGVLPVELTTFNANKSGKINILAWQTASERNNSHFNVERSFNGENGWATIGSVKGKGTSTLSNDYNFNDETPLSISYYRLKQMDFDGKSEYSKVVSVVGGKADKFKITAVSPNPFKDVATVVFDSNKEDNVTVTLTDVTGRVVLLKNVACTEGGNALTLDLAALSSGVYVVSLKNSDNVITQKIVKQ